MEYQALYRKYRPKTFDDVCGQEIIVQTLKNIIKNQKLTHAYLFIGPRGTGKTSIAKIFAKTINCLDSKDGISCEKCNICINNNNNENVDIIEMDAASNNGVDEIREIRNHVTLLPTISKYKVYIIDEVHMLTQGAFNALLKTLEEPPKHVIFILATTEPHKIPLTIISRCQSFEFKPISKQLMKERLNYICKQENISIEDSALDLIALDSNGGMRDAIGLLDQLNAYTDGNIKYDDVLLLNGRISTDDIVKIFEKINDNMLDELFNLIDEIEKNGKDFYYICEDMIKLLRDDLLSYKTNNNSHNHLVDENKITDVILLITKTADEMKNSKDKRILFDILVIQIYDKIRGEVQSKQIGEKQDITKSKTNVRIEKEQNNNKPEVKENKENKENDVSLYEKLMDIRLNNILAFANKKDLLEYKNALNNLDNDILDLDQLRIINTLSEFEVRAASQNGILLSTDIENILFDMYDDLFKAEEFLSNKFNKDIKLCILLNSKWNEMREIYVNKIKNKENIEKLDESDIIIEINKSLNKESSEFDDLLEIGGE